MTWTTPHHLVIDVGHRVRYLPSVSGAAGAAQRTQPAPDQGPSRRRRPAVRSFVVGPSSGLWMEEAACKGQPTETFFPHAGSSIFRARALCLGCPVRSQCLDYALADYELSGVWGGTTERERERIRRWAS